MENEYEVLIIGAGAAGLIAAMEMALAGKRTAVIEAKTQVGGRAQSLIKHGFEDPVETGAEFIHGDLDLTRQFLKKAGVNRFSVNGEFWQKMDGKWHEQTDIVEDFSALNKKLKALELDMPVQNFIDQYLQGDEFEEARFTLKSYVEGYYAADPRLASTFALREELNKSDEEQFRIDGGYTKLFDYFFTLCVEKGVQFYLSETVQSVTWQKGKVTVYSNSRTFYSQKLLITVPIGVIRSQTIHFSPSLANYESAANQLGFGGVVKTILQFKEPFWKNRELTQNRDLDKLGFVFSNAIIPTWWTRYPEDSSILTGWSGGPHAEEIKDLPDEEIFQKALDSLSRIFDVSREFLLQQITAWYVANWVKDPYCLGGYSYEVVNGSEAKATILQPVENTIWFSGEGLYEGIDIGTVNAALQMGRTSAHEMIASFKS